VLFTRVYSVNRVFESAYAVDEFRRLLPKVGTGRGLVQFWGDVKRRHQDADGRWTAWLAPERRDPDGLCTVEINDIVKIADRKRA
jgi:hypothetical protein